MLVIDISESMAATDVVPSRIEAAKEAGKHFADVLTPGINLGLVSFAANAVLLVAPTVDRGEVKRAIDTLEPAPRTATGEGIFSALQSIATVTSALGGGPGPPPARIVLESDGKETVPADPDLPRGAFTAAPRREGPGCGNLDDLVRHPRRVDTPRRGGGGGADQSPTATLIDRNGPVSTRHLRHHRLSRNNIFDQISCVAGLFAPMANDE
jgi:hypothetical protein